MLPHKKITIMVVDDELSIREAFSDWLKQDGYEVETAADGPVALAKIKERHYRYHARWTSKCRRWTGSRCSSN